jgi:hypothetical protein
MKTLKQLISLAAMIFLIPMGSIAQDMSKNQSFWVHEDVVKPGMVAEYEATCKELIGHLKEHKIQEANFIVTNTADSRYLYVGPIDNMADLDNSIFTTLAEKMGKANMDALFNRMDKCYDVEQDYVITLDNDLSYQPGGINQTPEGENYRKFHYLYVTPANRAVVKEKMKAVKDMFASKGSKIYYRVYKSGFGTRGEFYMVAVAAKDEVDYAQKAKANEVLLGEDGKMIMWDMFSNLLSYEEYVGEMRPDMAYSASN